MEPSKEMQQLEERNKKVVPISRDLEGSHALDRAISLAEDGAIDYRGKPVNKKTTGRLKANFFIIGMEFGERLAFYGISANLVNYLTSVLHEGTAPSAKNVNNWIGATFIAPLLGAFLADAYWGRFWTILICGSVYFVGLIMLTLSVTVHAFKPPECPTYMEDNASCPRATTTQVEFFYFALYLMSLGSGTMKPCIASFGADQFDEEDKIENKMKKSFFNWWVFGISIGGLISATVMVYIQDISWGWGFGVPTATMGIFLCIYVSGLRFYRHKRPNGSPFTQIAQVLVAAVRKWNVEVPKSDSALLYEIQDHESLLLGRRPIPHSITFRFLDKAAMLEDRSKFDVLNPADSSSPWRLCTVTQVEEVKLVLRLLPIWIAALVFATLPAQISTFYTRQGTTLNVNVGPHLKIPAASLQSFIPISIVTLIPLYDQVLVPAVRRFTGNVRGITMLQRIGIGLVISLVSMVAAAVTEIKRVQVAKHHGLLDKPEMTVPLSVFVLLPQYVLLGAAEVFTSIGALEFFYDQAPDSMRSLGTALFLSTIGVGNFLSSILLSGIVKLTSHGDRGWFVDNLNRCRLDYFYWLLAGLGALNLCFFMVLAHWYKYKKTESIVQLTKLSGSTSL